MAPQQARSQSPALDIASPPMPLERQVGPVAQWLEPTAHNGLVAGSSPAGPTTHTRERTRFLKSSKNSLCGELFIGGFVSAETVSRLRAAFAGKISGLEILVPGADFRVGRSPSLEAEGLSLSGPFRRHVAKPADSHSMG